MKALRVLVVLVMAVLFTALSIGAEEKMSSFELKIVPTHSYHELGMFIDAKDSHFYVVLTNISESDRHAEGTQVRRESGWHCGAPADRAFPPPR